MIWPRVPGESPGPARALKGQIAKIWIRSRDVVCGEGRRGGMGWGKPERTTGTPGWRNGDRERDTILRNGYPPPLIWMQVASWPGPCYTPVWKLPVCYHSGNVVACGEMKRRGKTGVMQMARRCWNGNEWQMRFFYFFFARLIEIH